MKRTGFLSLTMALLTVLVWLVMPVSNVALAVPAVPSPPAPKGLHATGAGNDWVKIAWSAASGAKSYNIYVATSSGGTYSLKGTSTATGYTVRGLSMGKTYWFKVKAKNASGTSGFSSAASKRTLSVLAVPTTFKATAASTTQINLTWKAVSGATSYQVYRSIGTSTTYAKIASVNVPKFDNTGLKAKIKYNYKVKAVRGSTQSAFSAVASAYVKSPAPTGVKATKIGNSQINVTWSAAAGATGYKLYVSVNGSKYNYLATASAASRKYGHIGLANGRYSYKVTAMIGNSESVPSAATPGIVVTGGSQPSLAAPTGVTAIKISETEIQITWNAVAGAASYRLYYSFNGSAYGYLTDLDSAPVNHYNLPQGSYSYTVTAIAGSTESTQSAATAAIYVAGAAQQPLPPATINAASISDTQIQVSWSAVAGATGYKLYYSTSDGSYNLLATLPLQTSYTHTGLAPGTHYYKVSTLIGNQESAQSAPAYVTLSGTKPIAPKFNVDLTDNNNGTVNVLFTEVGHVERTSLMFYYRYSATGSWSSMTFNGTQTTFTLTGVPSGYPVFTKFVAYNGTVEGDAQTYNPFASLASSSQPSASVDSINLQVAMNCGSVPYSTGINFYVSTLQPDGTYSSYKYMDYVLTSGNNPCSMTLASNTKVTFAHGGTYKVLACPYVAYTNSSGAYAEAESVYDKIVSISFS